MTGVGTRLSRILAIVMTIGLTLVGIGAFVGAAVIVISMTDPSVFADIHGQVNGRAIDLRDPSQSITAGMVIIVACLFAAIALWQLLGMLRSAAAGAPFTLDNVRRLQVLAGVFAAALLLQLVAFVVPGPLRDILNIQHNGIDGGTLLSALFALVLAEVFREGVRLREDVEGTV